MGKSTGPDGSGFLPINELPRSSGTAPRLFTYAERATVLARAWSQCQAVERIWLASGWEGWLGIFLLRIEPAQPEGERYLWAVAGEFPPALFFTDEIASPAGVLEFYLEEMNDWVRAVRTGRSTDGLIRVCYADSGRPMPEVEETADHVFQSMQILRQEMLPELLSLEA